MDARYFAFRGRDLLARRDGRRLVVPDETEWTALGLEAVRENELAVAETPAVAVELAAGVEPPAGMSFETMRRVFFDGDEGTVRLACRAVQIVEWDRGNL